MKSYINQIYLGHGTYGIEAASRFYFGKSAKDLNLAEASMIAGLPKAPNYYSPLVNYSRAKRRQSYVLKRMLKLGFITQEEKIEAENTPLEIKALKAPVKAPYFIEYIRQYVEGKYGKKALYEDGLRIETTLNYKMQKAAEEALKWGLSLYEKRHGISPNKARAVSYTHLTLPTKRIV